MKEFQTGNSFKNFFNKDKTPVPKYYYIKNRKAQFLHTRLRTNYSSFDLDLFLKGITDSPMCSCGSIENSQHFFFHCPHYQQQCNVLLNAVSTFHIPTLGLLLDGEPSLPHDTNIIIFEHADQFILNSNYTSNHAVVISRLFDCHSALPSLLFARYPIPIPPLTLFSNTLFVLFFIPFLRYPLSNCRIMLYKHTCYNVI